MVRLWFGWSLGLGVDESYMVASGRVLRLGYFDHPPAAWWIQWGAAHLFGSEAPIAVRAPFIALFALSTWLMYRLGTEVAGERAGFWAAAALTLSPVFGVTTGTWVLPDGPLDCALLGAALCLVHALRDRGAGWWLGAGLCAGLALFSKYSAVLTIGAAFLFLLAKPNRHWLRRWEPYAAGVLALAVFSPVVFWNATHHWASFAFQGDRAEGLRFRPLQPFIVWGGEALFVLPWIWLGLLVGAFASFLPARPHPNPLPQAGEGINRSRDAPLNSPVSRSREASLVSPLSRLRERVRVRERVREAPLLCALAAPPILLFSFIALWSSSRVLFHWAAPGYLMLFPLLGAWLADRGRFAARVTTGTAVFVLLGLVVVCSQVRVDWLHGLVRHDPNIEAVNWTSLRQNLAARGLLAPGTIIGVPNWRDAGKIAYVLGPGTTVTVLNPDAREFGFVAPAEHFIGQPMLVLAPAHGNRVVTSLGPHFAGIEELPPAPIRHAGHVLDEVAVFRTGKLLSAP